MARQIPLMGQWGRLERSSHHKLSHQFLPEDLSLPLCGLDPIPSSDRP